jgi:hypothetical protein
MAFELVYTIEKASIKKDHETFLLKSSKNDASQSVYIFDFVDKIQFKLYKNNIKLIEYNTNIEIGIYLFNFITTNNVNNFVFHPKTASRGGYKVKRKGSNESNKINWSWNYSSSTLDYTLINKNDQDVEVARITGYSLDGQNSGMLYITDTIPENYQDVIIFTACIIWNKNLLTPWNKLKSFLNYKK